MNYKDTLDTLEKMLDLINKTTSSGWSQDDHDTLSMLYGEVEDVVHELEGKEKIEVEIRGDTPPIICNNYIEAGYLSGRTFHTHQGRNQLLKVIGKVKILVENPETSHSLKNGGGVNEFSNATLMILDLPGDRTLLHPKLKKIVNDKYKWINKFKLTPWVFMGDGGTLKMEQFDGSHINYGGIKFDGSPRHVFWTSFIEPFLTDFIREMIDWTSNQCRENNLEPHLHFAETSGLLKLFTERIYKRMADIDQVLRGKGFPHSVERRDVRNKVNNISKYIDDHFSSELGLWESRSEGKNEPQVKSNEDSGYQVPNWLKITIYICLAVGSIWGVIELFFKNYIK